MSNVTKYDREGKHGKCPSARPPPPYRVKGMSSGSRKLDGLFNLKISEEIACACAYMQHDVIRGREVTTEKYGCGKWTQRPRSSIAPTRSKRACRHLG